jgi:hypothetical protein
MSGLYRSLKVTVAQSNSQFGVNTTIELKYIAGGACGGTVVEARRYKPEGRGLDSRWCHWNFSLT